MVIPSLDLVIVRLGWTAGGYPVNEIFSEIISSLQTGIDDLSAQPVVVLN